MKEGVKQDQSSVAN